MVLPLSSFLVVIPRLCSSRGKPILHKTLRWAESREDQARCVSCWCRRRSSSGVLAGVSSGAGATGGTGSAALANSSSSDSSQRICEPNTNPKLRVTSGSTSSIGKRVPRFELDGSHRLAADSAGNNELEVFKIGADVEGKAMRGYAARNVYADGGDLALAIFAVRSLSCGRRRSRRPSCLLCAGFQCDIARRCASAPLPACGRNPPRRALG